MLTVAGEGVALGMALGVTVGMVVCEWVANAFNHAFPAGKPGDVSVELSGAADDAVRLIV